MNGNLKLVITVGVTIVLTAFSTLVVTGQVLRDADVQSISVERDARIKDDEHLQDQIEAIRSEMRRGFERIEDKLDDIRKGTTP